MSNTFGFFVATAVSFIKPWQRGKINSVHSCSFHKPSFVCRFSKNWGTKHIRCTTSEASRQRQTEWLLFISTKHHINTTWNHHNILPGLSQLLGSNCRFPTETVMRFYKQRKRTLTLMNTFSSAQSPWWSINFCKAVHTVHLPMIQCTSCQLHN